MYALKLAGTIKRRRLYAEDERHLAEIFSSAQLPRQNLYLHMHPACPPRSISVSFSEGLQQNYDL